MPGSPVWFVMGKGGVGRSTIAAALGAACAARGERVLVVQWALNDAVSPLFGAKPGDFHEREIAPRLSTMRYSFDETLREYFVDHLHLRWFHELVVKNRHVQRFSHAAPGLEELLFLGRLSWLSSSVAPSAWLDRGWSYDRVVVDAPALGHGLSLFGVPHAAASLGLGGLLAGECERVQAMLNDRSAAVLTTTGEELAVEETLELLPRFQREMGRPPILSIINRSLTKLGEMAPRPAWLEPPLAPLYGSLVRRSQREELLVGRLPAPLVRVDEAFLGDVPPLECAKAALGEWLSCHG